MGDQLYTQKVALVDGLASGANLKINPDGSINITGEVVLDVSSVEIGEVVLKDGASANTAAIDSSGRLSVDGSSVTQPVSAAALPLPSGASTAGNQASIISAIGTTNTLLGTAATAARQDTGNTALAAIQAALTNPLPVSALSWPLPTGAARDSSLTTINTTLGAPFQAGGSIGNTSFGISGTLPAFAATPTVNLGATDAANLASTASSTGTLAGAVSGAKVAVSVSALPLPANAAQETSGNLQLQVGLLSQLLREAQQLRQLVAANAGGFVPVPETPVFLN